MSLGPSTAERFLKNCDHRSNLIARITNHLAIQLYYKILHDQHMQPVENVFFSPLSIALALAMLAEGAKDSTSAELSKLLAIESDEERKTMPTAAFSLMQEISKQSRQGIVLEIANALFVQDKFQLENFYSELLKRSYSAEAVSVNFQEKEAACHKVNQWIDAHTRGMIQEILSPDTLDAMTRLVLVNTVYFKGKWEKPFEKSDTKELEFHVSGSESVRTPMMTHTQLEMPYIHDTEHKVIVAALPYRLKIESDLDDGAFQMVVLLPSDVPDDAPNQLPKLEKALQQNKNLLNDWLYSLDQQRGIAVDTVRVPRFKFEHSLNLKQLLIDLGAKQIFSKEANFKGITSSSPFFVSDAMHRAVVEVNEEGTVAAAVTAMRMVLESASYSPVPLYLILDHPFIFLLRSRPGSLRGYDTLPPIIYFMGRYNRPPATM